ncbi:hypothetical protein QBC35DRAFT_256178 [Podospora australis]|uniref:T6SS Phospholipase effector Tle1-like catalytic domain-containing protein n=1 Tax=Podospora australis TaxID=1536484 RepID=A0AAN6WRK9_9PEZI|nr:hypothetical protein QBC35DRAFT_256178 [Podospora australis]
MASPYDPDYPHRRGQPKRLIICCDGTWMDSLGKKGHEPPSNVTRISRVLCRTCSDGTHQIINYFPGVGTANGLDQITGGAFGMGLDQDIREVYNFICTNYVDGDSIILIGFSRGAFTARSVADMIASVGLLTPEGLDNFYAIFDDYENMGNTMRDVDDYLIPGLAVYNGSYGQAKIEWEERRKRVYKEGLKRLRYTRDTYQDGVTEIRIKALAVWDTVGALGIPPAPVIGVRGSADQWRFTNTQISNKVENAFQALALDEPRYAFRPALWERFPGSSSTNLKQVWFPGNHGNVGGGWWDQQIADITLAWMCDQLSVLGLEFNHPRMTAMFRASLRFSATHPFPYAPQSKTSSVVNTVTKSIIPRSVSKLLRGGRSPSSPTNGHTHSNGITPSSLLPFLGTPKPWAHPAIFRHPFSAPKRDAAECDGKHPHPDGPLSQLWQFARPWGLGTIRSPSNVVTTMAGKTIRRPGLIMRVDEDTNEDTAEPLLGTNERIHSSVRVRLACGGLGLDDRDIWTCDALLKSDDSRPLWKLERGSALSSGEEGFVKAWRERPREVTLFTKPQAGGGRREVGQQVVEEYPASCMYPVGETDQKWKWVYQGKPVPGRNGSRSGRVPQVLELPEEPLVGYWERYLLALMVGEVDVWRFAALQGGGAPAR